LEKCFSHCSKLFEYGPQYDSFRDKEGETCPAGLGGGVGSGKVRLAINALLVKG